MEDFSENNLAGALLLLRKHNGYSIKGCWSLCTFDLGEEHSLSEDDVIRAFDEELETYFLGDRHISYLTIEGPYSHIVFFLIPTMHTGEIGRKIYSFRVTQEQ
jgi:hypothetical protein